MIFERIVKIVQSRAVLTLELPCLGESCSVQPERIRIAARLEEWEGQAEYLPFIVDFKCHCSFATGPVCWVLVVAMGQCMKARTACKSTNTGANILATYLRQELEADLAEEPSHDAVPYFNTNPNFSLMIRVPSNRQHLNFDGYHFCRWAFARLQKFTVASSPHLT